MDSFSNTIASLLSIYSPSMRPYNMERLKGILGGSGLVGDVDREVDYLKVTQHILMSNDITQC